MFLHVYTYHYLPFIFSKQLGPFYWQCFTRIGEGQSVIVTWISWKIHVYCTVISQNTTSKPHILTSDTGSSEGNYAAKRTVPKHLEVPRVWWWKPVQTRRNICICACANSIFSNKILLLTLYFRFLQGRNSSITGLNQRFVRWQKFRVYLFQRIMKHNRHPYFPCWTWWFVKSR